MPKETLRSEWVKCGKPGCGSCPHGPYWYAYWKEDGKTRKRYIGKDLPRAGADKKAEPEKRHRWDDIMNDRTANPSLAYEILGIPTSATFEQARSAFRKLSMEHHPDRGGDVWTACRVNAAWAYLRAYQSWK